MENEYNDITEYQRDVLKKFEAEWPEHAEVLKITLAPFRQIIDEMTAVMRMMAEQITTRPPS